MTRPSATLALTTVALLMPTAAYAAEEVPVSDLVELGAEYAGQEVSVEGELVADYGFRRDGWMWTQLNGDAYATDPIREGGAAVGGNSGIGIRMRINLGVGLDPPGRYQTRGPLVSVTGTWKHHDPNRQGESYLEVESLTVLEPGRRTPEGIDWVTIFSGLAVSAAAAILWRFWKTT